MQSFLFKTICCILIVNATFCSGCFRSICKARCYFKHSGFDFGYCEQGICKCAPPIIYVFDGIGRDLSDEYIDNSLDNNNVIQNLTPKSSTSASNISDENKKNKIWNDIVGKIINKNPFIKEENLKDLKAKIFNDISDLNNFSIGLQNSLETALDEMKNKMPSAFKECNDLLILLLQQQKKNDDEHLNSEGVPMINEAQNPPLPQATNPSSQVPPQIANPNSNNPQSKSKTNQNTNEQDKLNAEIVVELSEETVEYDDSEEQTDENIKKNNSEKPQTPDNNKTGGKFPPVKKENRDDDDSYEYELGSGSGSYETVEEKYEPVPANAAV